MKSRWMAGYDAFYAEEIEPLLNDLESARKVARTKALRRASITVALVGAAALPAFYSAEESDFGFFVVIGGALLGAIFVSAPINQVRASVKELLIGRLCSFFELRYTAKPRNFDYMRFRRLSLLPRQDEIEIEDSISGDHNGVSLEFIEVHLRKVSQSGRSRQKETVFRGPAMVFGFPKRFNGRTIIKSDRTAIGNFLTEFGAVGDRVKLEHPEFERRFEVYSSDQVEARYLLTPIFMERLLSLRRALGNNVCAAFEGDQMLLAANNDQNRFETDVWSSDYDLVAQTRKFVGEIGLLFELIESLQLDATHHLQNDDP